MMSSADIRTARLHDLSKMVVNGQVTSKLDHIAAISINGSWYFNVYRRYNSPYNIVIEDKNFDIYLHGDYTVRQSLGTILCLPPWEASNIYTWNAISYMHNGPPPSLSMDIADMSWTEIQDRYQAVNVNFGGIFHYLPPVHEVVEEDIKEEDTLSTPRSQMIQTPTDPPGAPERPPSRETVEAAHALLLLSIPRPDDAWEEREDDGPTLSMRFADIQSRKRKREPVCYCEMHSDDESDDETVDMNNFTILRNGTMIPKAGVQ